MISNTSNRASFPFGTHISEAWTVNGGRRGLIGSKTITTDCDAQAFEAAVRRAFDQESEHQRRLARIFNCA